MTGCESTQVRLHIIVPGGWHMLKVKNLIKKVKSSNLVTSLALTVVAVAEVAFDSCIVWILGQDDMPDELI